MRAGTKFTIGAVLIVGSVGWLMASGIKETGQYFLTPSELSRKVATDPSFYNVGMKVGAHVVPGSVVREVATQTLTFRVTDGSAIYPVSFHGLPPDTFTDSVEVVARITPSRCRRPSTDRKSTRLNSSHSQISYAVFCLKKNKILVRTHHVLVS